jgi:hypothetical protein
MSDNEQTIQPVTLCPECNRLASLCVELGKALSDLVDMSNHSYTRQRAMKLLEREGLEQ